MKEWIIKIAKDIKIESPYLNLIEIPSKGITKIYEVSSIKHGSQLGIIKWYSSWRQYTFYPNADTIFSSDCMKAICDVLDKLKQSRMNQEKE